MISVLALAASPRIGGNSETLLDELLRGATETWKERGLDAEVRVEKIRLATCRILPCTHCDYCSTQMTCILDDDMRNLYPKLERSDWLILASPIYFMAHNAQAKLFIDRCQPFWAARYLRHHSFQLPDRPRRRGLFVAAGATHGPKVFAGAKVTMKWFFHSLDMDYWADCCIEGLERRSAARETPDALRQAFDLGRKLTRDS